MRRPLLLAALLLAPSCGPVAAATEGVTSAVGDVLLSEDDLQRLGDRLSQQVAQEEPVHSSQDVQDYLDRVGQQVLDAVPQDERRFPSYEFTVLDRPDTVNAFALPGGHIYVYSGLVCAAESEAQLASVLAHEVAHVTQGHVADRLAAQYGTQLLLSIALGQDPGALVQLGAQLAAQGYLAAYSRDTEAEADRYGLEYLAQAGYEPDAMAQFFQELADLRGDSGGFVSDYFASHPAPGDRVDDVRELIQENGYGGGQTSVVGDLETLRSRLDCPPGT